MFIDVHCHLDHFDSIDEVIARARNTGVHLVVTQGTNANTNEAALALGKQFAEIHVALGLYPTDSLNLSKRELAEYVEKIRLMKKRIVAIGEVGLDLKEIPTLDKQQEAFQAMIDLALELDKPLIVHSRKAELICIEQLEVSGIQKVIMHCFSGKLSLAKRIADNGWYLSIPTSVKNSEHFQKVIEQTPVEQLLCETDSPYLHPDREFPNEPAQVVVSYEMISKIKKLTLKETEIQIENNYKRLFQ